MTATWTVLVPAKPLATAKSRLHTPNGITRADLALAMLQDTLTVALSCPSVAQVLVLTADPVIADIAQRCGATVQGEPPPRDMNDSLTKATATLTPGQHLAVLTGDLPYLRGNDLQAILHLASAHHRAFVPDRSGTGTTVLTTTEPGTLRPRFGAGSAQAHRRSGAIAMHASPGARHDVDTWCDLQAATGHDLGHHTLAALRGRRRPPVTSIQIGRTPDPAPAAPPPAPVGLASEREMTHDCQLAG